MRQTPNGLIAAVVHQDRGVIWRSKLTDDEKERIEGAVCSGQTPDPIYDQMGQRREVFLYAVEAVVRRRGDFAAFAPTPERVVRLRDDRRLRWEDLAACVFGDASRTTDVKRLYDAQQGPNASRRSYTGRGRRSPDMGVPSPLPPRRHRGL